MALSVVDLYRQVLPRTNCGDCGFPTCLAFASMVVAEKLPLKTCPHLSAEQIRRYQPELDAQHAAGRWVKKDMLAEALQWARQRAASMRIEDLPERIGGVLAAEGTVLELPYFADTVRISGDGIARGDGSELNRWEQVFLFNHMAQGGSALPAGAWKSLEQFPNTISKIKSMREHVEQPLLERFSGRSGELARAGIALGATDVHDSFDQADVALRLTPLPRIPVLLLFWEQDASEGLEARVKLLFDETVTEHLDIESILFLSERIRQLLCDQEA